VKFRPGNVSGGARPGRGLLAGAAFAAAATLLSGFFLAGAPAGAAQAQITVYAASSLTDVFPEIDGSPRYSFGGSNTLAAQIRQGAPAQVFASANMSIPRQLARQGLCSKPVVFTRNALVLIVPSANPAGIKSVYDLRKPGTKLVIAGEGVPVGSYTRRILGKMNLKSVLSNVVSNETNVREVLAKVALGEADAGFVYATDAKTVPGRLAILRLPARAQPNVAYGICIPTSAKGNADARAFIHGVLGKAGQAKLIAAGFLPRVEARVVVPVEKATPKHNKKPAKKRR
jgi:molybdate transport system substrate-binding protein